MRRRVLLLAFFFSVPLLLTPTLPARNKPKGATSDKIRQDLSKFVDIPGAETVGTEQCAACHADLSKGFRRSAHAMQEVTCEQCHGPGSLHIAAGGYSKESKDKIISFRDRNAEDANGACLSCHSKSRPCAELVFERACCAGYEVHRLPHHPRCRKQRRTRRAGDACRRYRSTAAAGVTPYPERQMSAVSPQAGGTGRPPLSPPHP